MELPLGNGTPLLVNHIHVDLAPGSHHLIVYRSTATAPSLTPTPCQPLGGIQTGSAPIFIAQASSTDLVVPAGIGIQIAANQYIRIEEHFINLTSGPLEGTATVQIDTVPNSPCVTPSDLMFWGTEDIDLLPHSTGTADMFDIVPAGRQIFGMTTHEHELGTLATISQAPDATSTGTLLYSNSNWAEPMLRQYAPPLSFDGTTGLHLHCEQQQHLRHGGDVWRERYRQRDVLLLGLLLSVSRLRRPVLTPRPPRRHRPRSAEPATVNASHGETWRVLWRLDAQTPWSRLKARPSSGAINVAIVETPRGSRNKYKCTTRSLGSSV